MRERLQKLMAAAGFGSRRACEEMILDGTVTVNGEVVSELPVMVDPAKDRVVIAGKPLRMEKPVYFLMNKPRGVLCTHDDPSGRKRVIDLLVGVRERVFPVGRLDIESTGLIILTNDGALTQKLTHPRFGVPKTYRAEVMGLPSEETLDKARKGVWLAEGKSAPAKIEFIHKQRDRAILEITLREGRDREVRRVLAKLGHKVLRLARIQIGKLSIQRLPLGAFRMLAPAEVKYLFELVERPDAEFVRPAARSSTGGPARGRKPQVTERISHSSRSREQKAPRPQRAGHAAKQPRRPKAQPQPAAKPQTGQGPAPRRIVVLD